jgi:hypothetical protein
LGDIWAWLEEVTTGSVKRREPNMWKTCWPATTRGRFFNGFCSWMATRRARRKVHRWDTGRKPDRGGPMSSKLPISGKASQYSNVTETAPLAWNPTHQNNCHKVRVYLGHTTQSNLDEFTLKSPKGHSVLGPLSPVSKGP